MVKTLVFHGIVIAFGMIQLAQTIINSVAVFSKDLQRQKWAPKDKLPPLKLTFSPLKIDPWKFGDSYWKPIIFRVLCAMLVLGCFREGICKNGGPKAPSIGVDKKNPRVKAILVGFLKWWVFPPQKSSILRGFFSIYVHHPFWGGSPYFWFNTHLGLGFNSTCFYQLWPQISGTV